MVHILFTRPTHVTPAFIHLSTVCGSHLDIQELGPSMKERMVSQAVVAHLRRALRRNTNTQMGTVLSAFIDRSTLCLNQNPQSIACSRSTLAQG